MESVDRILAELKAQNVGENPDQNLGKDTTHGSPAYGATGQGSTTQEASAQGASTQPPANTSPANTSPAHTSPAQSNISVRSLDQLLSQLGEPQKHDIRTQLSQRHQPQPNQQLPITSASAAASPNTAPESVQYPPRQDSFMLEQLKAKYRAEDAAIAKQQKQQAAQQHEQVAQQRQALTQAAQQWLKQVDIRSEEGLWFEEFAYNYDSRLEAAIEYLEALEQSP